MEDFKREIICNKKDDFCYSRSIGYSCGCRFEINKENVYAVNTIDYSSESVTEYYSLCPICGRINKINEEILPEYIKELAVLKYEGEPFQFHKNDLRSELIYLDMISPPKMRTRIK